jgi:hypothetical protein
VLQHYKVVPLQPVEHSLTPHDVWDRWVELYGDGLDAFYPVADTEIGRLGVMMANEASYSENARGLALGGCEVAYRGPYPHPYAGNGFYEIQNRARAASGPARTPAVGTEPATAAPTPRGRRHEPPNPRYAPLP